MCHTFNIKGVVVLSQANIYIGLIWLLWVASPSEIHSQRLSETYHNVYCTCNVLVLSVVLLEIVNFVAFSRVLQLLSRQIWSLFVLAKTNSTLHARMLSNDRKEHSITIANLKPFHFKVNSALDVLKSHYLTCDTWWQIHLTTGGIIVKFN